MLVEAHVTLAGQGFISLGISTNQAVFFPLERIDRYCIVANVLAIY